MCSPGLFLFAAESPVQNFFPQRCIGSSGGARGYGEPKLLSVHSSVWWCTWSRSGVCCLLPSAGGLQRVHVSSSGSVFETLASFRGDARRTWWWRVRSRASLFYVLSERVLRSYLEVVPSIVQEPLVSLSLQ